MITSLFVFRARDIARVAAYFLARRPAATVGNICVLVVSLAIVALTSEAVLALLGSALVLFVLRNCRPMINEVREKFTQ